MWLMPVLFLQHDFFSPSIEKWGLCVPFSNLGRWLWLGCLDQSVWQGNVTHVHLDPLGCSCWRMPPVRKQSNCCEAATLWGSLNQAPWRHGETLRWLRERTPDPLPAVSTLHCASHSLTAVALETWSRTTRTNPPWIPDPQKPWEIRKWLLL